MMSWCNEKVRGHGMRYEYFSPDPDGMMPGSYWISVTLLQPAR
uniref:Uncharacterized protein n=1 Tax=Klebsiella pneumoniae TaxID=573 RepID=A0A3G1IEH4_KLEPN|nr:hypothetical protein pPUTH1_0322 [Klebsiella pneumoniae]